MAKIDLRDLHLDDLVEGLRGEAGKRASGIFGASGEQVKRGRRALADPNDGDMFGAFALGILVGAVVGAAFALILAPYSGDEARRRIGRRVDEMRGEGKPTWDGPGVRSKGNGESVYQPVAQRPLS